mmetsp:Transcript_10700/g.21416  ORF Transcript_10700/g.21416 Transcript_10700/m.21416 type:complete len:83 (+) Transcript_10700:27-275(+)
MVIPSRVMNLHRRKKAAGLPPRQGADSLLVLDIPDQHNGKENTHKRNNTQAFRCCRSCSEMILSKRKKKRRVYQEAYHNLSK